MKSETDTIIAALRVLARDIQTDDGVVNTCLEEAAGRLEELQRANKNTLADLAVAIEQRDEALKNQQPTTIVQRLTTRQEPSRLEIAAMLLAALAGRESGTWEWQEEAIWAVEQADALIAAAKEIE
jgi:hypothetical protein